MAIPLLKIEDFENNLKLGIRSLNIGALKSTVLNT